MVLNVHSRLLPVSLEAARSLLRDLASHEDQLWPGDRWWPQRFEGGLVVGARGGHGPVRYKVESVSPDEVVYRFPRKSWFVGTHSFRLSDESGQVLLTHTLRGRARGLGLLFWPLAIRPLHDALLEDVMDRAQVAVGAAASGPAHSRYVRWLRRRWLHLSNA
jgi:hypothetical protein